MIRKTLFTVLVYLLPLALLAQQQQGRIRIVDSLSRQERATRNPVLLKAELDSMVQAYMATLPPAAPKEVIVREPVEKVPDWILIAAGVVIVAIFGLLYVLWHYHRRLTHTVGDLKRLMKNFDFYVKSQASDKKTAGRPVYDRKMAAMQSELEKQQALYANLAREYGLVKEAIADTYKLRNYPLYSKQKTEGELVLDLLQAEKKIARHAFEKFIKPAIALTDKYKNNPARIPQEDSTKLLELFLSLALYQTEYLYLRIPDLSIGGHIAHRVGSNGKGIDPALLKKLNTEHGSRALALRIALDKAGIENLTYPVFEETDLNQH